METFDNVVELMAERGEFFTGIEMMIFAILILLVVVVVFKRRKREK